jgi:ATP-dependent protease HslVU (ClpYQ) peptidase subunit
VIHQRGDAFARRKLSVAVLLVDFLGPTAEAQTLLELLKTLDKLFHVTGGYGGHDFY